MTEDNKDLHSVKHLKGVGPKISESLKSLGILSVQDAMFHLPFRSEDRTVLTPIWEASYEKSVLIWNLLKNFGSFWKLEKNTGYYQ